MWTILIKEVPDGRIVAEGGIADVAGVLGRGVCGVVSQSVVRFRNYNIDLLAMSNHKGNLSVAPVFSNNMVLQRNMKLPIWGKTTPGAPVQLVLQKGKTYRTTATTDGDWKIELDPLPVSRAIKLSIVSGKDTIWLNDVAVGEVWLAAGQSNMELPVAETNVERNIRKRIPDADIRFFLQPQWSSSHPVYESGGTWEKSNEKNVLDWSAIAYAVAAHLKDSLKMPIGIVGSYRGATVAECWVAREDLMTADLTKPIAIQYNNALLALEGGKEPNKNIRPTLVPGQHMAPGYYFNGMIAPLIPYAIRGVIWYQGEGNAMRAKQYSQLFPLLIRSWRKKWNQSDLPFYFVQLAGFAGTEKWGPADGIWAHLRDVQRRTLDSVKVNTGMAVAFDKGDSLNIHPWCKQEVADRLSRLLLHDVYGYTNIVRSSPLYNISKIENDKIILSFKETANGLKIENGTSLTGFTILGEKDDVFVPAQAVINKDGKSVTVWSNKIKKPVAVRYAWSNYPTDGNLVNSEGLPASPFRTDDLPLVNDQLR